MSTNGNAEHLSSDLESGEALQKIRTAGAISISPELFEKLYLEPKDAAAPASGIRKAVGNPTPIAIVGFLLALTPLTFDLMNFRGAQLTNGSASIGVFFFFGGLLMSFGALGEFIVGNTFPCVVFFSFSAFWLTYGATLQPFYSASANYALALGEPAGTTTPPFLNAFGYFLLWMGILCLIYTICALRTNLVFVTIFITLVGAFGCLAGAFFRLAEGKTSEGEKLLIAGGACAFVTCVAGWYLLFAILLGSLDFPFSLPVFDLSHIVKGRKERRA